MVHLTYSEYTENGGKYDEASFKLYLPKAEAKLIYLTDKRINKFTELPLCVKQLMVETIDFLGGINKTGSGVQMTNGGTLASYSNGIESFAFNNTSGRSFMTSINSHIFAICTEYLAEYPELLYRGVGRYENFGNYTQ